MPFCIFIAPSFAIGSHPVDTMHILSSSFEQVVNTQWTRKLIESDQGHCPFGGHLVFKRSVAIEVAPEY